MTERFHVERTLPNLWKVTDRRKHLVELVLFGEYAPQHVRTFVTLEAWGDVHSEALRQMARKAHRAGVVHTFVPPPRLARVQRYS